MVELTVAHWVYAIFIVLILVTMALRRETPLVCIVGSFILSWVITGHLVKAVQAGVSKDVLIGYGLIS